MAQIKGNKYVIVVIGNANDHAFNTSKDDYFVNKAAIFSNGVFGSGYNKVNVVSQ